MKEPKRWASCVAGELPLVHERLEDGTVNHYEVQVGDKLVDSFDLLVLDAITGERIADGVVEADESWGYRYYSNAPIPEDAVEIPILSSDRKIILTTREGLRLVDCELVALPAPDPQP